MSLISIFASTIAVLLCVACFTYEKDIPLVFTDNNKLDRLIGITIALLLSIVILTAASLDSIHALNTQEEKAAILESCFRSHLSSSLSPANLKTLTSIEYNKQSKHIHVSYYPSPTIRIDLKFNYALKFNEASFSPASETTNTVYRPPLEESDAWIGTNK